MATFGQPKMMEKQIETIQGYPPEILKLLTVIVVDDCGEPPAVVPKTWGLFRVTKDIPWNQCGARNLGMHHANGWCVMLDPDMVVSAGMVCMFMDRLAWVRRGEVVRFGLKHMNGSHKGVDMTSPNTYLIHREDFWQVGGYDESYAGLKGWSDVTLLDVLGAHFKIRMARDLSVDYYDAKMIPDAMVTSLNRSVRENKNLRLRHVAQSRACGGWKRWVRKHKGKVLQFPWEQKQPPHA